MPHVLQALRRATHDVHARLEARLALFDGPPSRTRYRMLLAAHHGFYAPIEGRLPEAALRARGFDLEARRKIPALRADLRDLGFDDAAIDALPRCRTIPSIDPADGSALGVAYVLEGATLGGRVLSRHFRSTLGIDETHGGRFFVGYGDQTGDRWRAFVEILGREGRDREGSIVAAATATFESFERWLATRGLLR